MADVEDGVVQDAVFIYTINRLVREAADYFVFANRVQACGLAIMSISEGVDTSVPGGQVTAGIMAVLAQEQKRQLLELTYNGKKRAARAGKWVMGITPYDYDRDPRTSQLQINPEEAHIVRQIFARFAGGESVLSLVRWLNESGVPTRRQGNWWPATIRQILKNRTYLGEGRFNTTRAVKRPGQPERRQPRPEEELILVPVPPIVDEALWHAADAAYRGFTLRTHDAETFLLKGRVCGRRFHRVKPRRSGRGRPYYKHYENRALDGTTSHQCDEGYLKQLSALPVNEAVWNEVYECARDPEQWLEELRERLKRLPARDWAAETRAVERKITALRRRREKLVDLYLGDVIEQAAFDARVEHIDHQHLTAQHEALVLGQQQEDDALVWIRDDNEVRRWAEAILTAEDASTRRRILVAVLERVELWVENGQRHLHLVWREDSHVSNQSTCQ